MNRKKKKKKTGPRTNIHAPVSESFFPAASSRRAQRICHRALIKTLSIYGCFLLFSYPLSSLYIQHPSGHRTRFAKKLRSSVCMCVQSFYNSFSLLNFSFSFSPTAFFNPSPFYIFLPIQLYIFNHPRDHIRYANLSIECAEFAIF